MIPATRLLRPGPCAALIVAMALLGLMGCAVTPTLTPAPTVGSSAAASSAEALPEEPPSSAGVPSVAEVTHLPDWRGFRLPGKRLTHYQSAQRDGRRAIHASSDRSASMLRHMVNLPPEALHALQFSWWVPALIPGAVLGERDADDTPVRIVLAFDGDHAKLSMKERMQFELAEAVTGERPPYATLMYVWDTHRAPGEVIMSPRTDRIRKLVVESGGARLKRWCDYRRDIVADFRRVYGENPGRLMAIGVMTDTDNTQTRTEAWYGDIQLLPR